MTVLGLPCRANFSLVAPNGQSNESRLCTFIAEGTGLIPSQGTKIPTSHVAK